MGKLRHYLIRARTLPCLTISQGVVEWDYLVDSVRERRVSFAKLDGKSEVIQGVDRIEINFDNNPVHSYSFLRLK